MQKDIIKAQLLKKLIASYDLIEETMTSSVKETSHFEVQPEELVYFTKRTITVVSNLQGSNIGWLIGNRPHDFAEIIKSYNLNVQSNVSRITDKVSQEIFRIHGIK